MFVNKTLNRQKHGAYLVKKEKQYILYSTFCSEGDGCVERRPE